MKNAFGGLLNLNRHWTHSVIHETLVDLLRIQKEIHPGIFAVMDGTIAGDGPGPRCMRPHVKNYILASDDCVAIDAIAAKMMGFDPMTDLKFIRLAHENGLGVGRPEEIEIVGDDIKGVNFGFRGSLNENTFASWGQKLIYWGPLKPLENLLLRSPIVPWSYARLAGLPRRLLVPDQGQAARARDHEDRLGRAVPRLRRRQGAAEGVAGPAVPPRGCRQGISPVAGPGPGPCEHAGSAQADTPWDIRMDLCPQPTGVSCFTAVGCAS